MHNNTEDSWGMVFQHHLKEERRPPSTINIDKLKHWTFQSVAKEQLDNIFIMVRLIWNPFYFWFFHRHCKISLVARSGAEQDAWRLSAGSASVSLWRKPLNTSLFADLPPRHQRHARLPSEVQQCRWHILLQVHGVLPCLSLIWGSSLLFDLKPRGCQPTLLAWITFLWISTACHSVRDASTYEFFNCF